MFSILVGLGFILNLYVFFLPYDNGADENDYITQVLSLAVGEPEGWNLRSFFYPSLLVPSVWLAKLISIDNISTHILFIRFLNWICVWITLYIIYKIAKRFFNSNTARLTVILLLFYWPWIQYSRHLMMDVPAAMWLTLSIWFASGNIKLSKNIIFATVFASMAVFTKFQMGAAAIGIAAALLLQSNRSRDLFRTSIIMTSTAAAMLTVFAIVDTATWGFPFSSFLNFIQYNFGNAEAFQQHYGAYPPQTFYITIIFVIYDRIFPLLILVGLIVSIYRISFTFPILLPLFFYFASIQFVNWKNARYLYPVTPLLILTGAYGIEICKNILSKAIHSIKLDDRVTKHAVNIFTFCLTFITIVSFVPWYSIRTKLSKIEPCSDFVYDVVLKNKCIPKESKVLFFGPCAVPKYVLRDYHPCSRKFDIGNLRHYSTKTDVGELTLSKETEKARLRRLNNLVRTYDFAIIKRGDVFDEKLLEALEKRPEIVLESKSGDYLVYKLTMTKLSAINTE
jgi:hypothetical protein